MDKFTIIHYENFDLFFFSRHFFTTFKTLQKVARKVELLLLSTVFFKTLQKGARKVELLQLAAVFFKTLQKGGKCSYYSFQQCFLRPYKKVQESGAIIAFNSVF